ncbi:hypothetical protein ACHAXR_002643 [Thalassiosira sp. AJA248-18]
MTTLSGCRIARYLYTIEDEKYHNPAIAYPRWNECSNYPRPQDELNAPIIGDGVQTVFVPITALDQFVDKMLDWILTDIVVISSRDWITVGASNLTIQKLLNNTNVLLWFCTNLPVYGGPNPHHPKISPWPFGLREIGARGTIAHEAYKKVYTEQRNKSNSTKSMSIYAGPLSTKDGRRSNIPNSPKLPPEDFFIKMATANYILSPNGDRPDCYRHYEAIGLGTVPITQLDPILYRHLADGPAIFNNSDWNLQSLESKLDPHPVVNRDLVLEDYWMDYAERVVGKKLNWNTKFH